VSDLGRKEWQNITGNNTSTPPKSHSTNFVPLSTENSSLISDGSNGNQKYGTYFITNTFKFLSRIVIKIVNILNLNYLPIQI